METIDQVNQYISDIKEGLKENRFTLKDQNHEQGFESYIFSYKTGLFFLEINKNVKFPNWKFGIVNITLQPVFEQKFEIEIIKNIKYKSFTTKLQNYQEILDKISRDLNLDITPYSLIFLALSEEDIKSWKYMNNLSKRNIEKGGVIKGRSTGLKLLNQAFGPDMFQFQFSNAPSILQLNSDIPKMKITSNHQKMEAQELLEKWKTSGSID